MRIERYQDVRVFWGVVEGFYATDPVRHTVPLTVLSRLVALDEPPAGMVLLAVFDGDEVVGATFQYGAWPLSLSGLGVGVQGAVVEFLLEHGIDFRRVQGPRDVTDSFAGVWSGAAGVGVERVRSERLFRLGELVEPTVAGGVRLGAEADSELLGRWCSEFSDEALDGDEGLPDPVQFARDALASGRGAPIWVDGIPVAMALVTKPVLGMSRIGPVYTPKDHRGQGYGSAVTAAAAKWARERGAREVLLFADLDNPVANSIYQRIGFRPVFEAVETTFTGRNTLGM
ncbi:GNAT superfamily N-acetyltransferase [Actinokineospora baliensis]|uniref:GNAT family N-acetyltransferase n=1 Tax=Actinokineospora baliensis TaxID=547056 RepID=UPI001959A2FC|nr:GNAT family N-acetyltransferase [Actinokineospora baliensis]MBM7772184.1 GNAT superfamily N-acetyltransferase [Actinokineospora baliensis]